MVANLDKLIRNTEEKWLKRLFEACNSQFVEVHLPSHDAWHHRRVWEYAKTLLRHASVKGTVISETDIERLIIAVFFHDQGMGKTLSKEHGKISRQVCKAYFAAYPDEPVSGFDKVLQAVENHDKKEYSQGASSSLRKNEFDLQKYLNLADDLDALGKAGAYRYSEIYLLRHVSIDELPEKVLPNLYSRFQYFKEVFQEDPSLVKAQNQRYMAARNFFKDLNMQVKMIGYSDRCNVGPIGVVNYIKKEIIDGKRPLNEACREVLSTSEDFYSRHFFERMLKEMTVKF
ncbi:MAG: HD domain-containing protein [Bacteroidota bacterium]|nr:HD domain-containing protein [Bacteroidota bacterium]